MIQLRATTALVLFLVAACETSGGGSRQARPNSVESSRLPRAVVAGCGSAIVGDADPRWREKSSIVSDLGFYGPGRDFRDSAIRLRKGGDLVTKLPVIIEGPGRATVWLPRTEHGRAALLFGDLVESYRIEDGATRVRFEPCEDKKRTGWPGGFALKDRGEIAVRVRIDGASRPVTVTLGRLPDTEG